MHLVRDLLDKNKQWARSIEDDEPGFFARLSKDQSPHFFWIGCSDSRVPAEQITGLMPGDLFVHRNIANLVVNEDLSCQAALQYAVDVLKVRHVLLVGHYGCGGVRAAMQSEEFPGPAGEWLRPLRNLYQQREKSIASWDECCELNVVAQVNALGRFPVIHGAWERGQELAIHGWIYNSRDGHLKDLNMTITGYPDTKTTSIERGP